MDPVVTPVTWDIEVQGVLAIFAGGFLASIGITGVLVLVVRAMRRVFGSDE